MGLAPTLLVYKHSADGSMGCFEPPPRGCVHRDGVLGVPWSGTSGTFSHLQWRGWGKRWFWPLLWLAGSKQSISAHGWPEGRVRGRNPPSSPPPAPQQAANILFRISLGSEARDVSEVLRKC